MRTRKEALKELQAYYKEEVKAQDAWIPYLEQIKLKVQEVVVDEEESQEEDFLHDEDSWGDSWENSENSWEDDSWGYDE